MLKFLDKHVKDDDDLAFYIPFNINKLYWVDEHGNEMRYLNISSKYDCQ